MQACLLSRRLELRKAWSALPSRIFVIALLCPPALALNPEWQIYQYGHRAWKIGDTFPGGAVNAITQDADGYLWAGTKSGLLRFDGVRFAPWTPPAGSRPVDEITSLLADRDGSLWIGTANGVRHWDHHRLTPYLFENQEVFVPNILQDKDGTIWFAPFLLSSNRDALVCSVSHARLTCYGNDGSVPYLTPSLATIMDSSGTMWLGESESLIAWRNGSARNYPCPSLRNNTTQEGILALADAEDGSLLVGISKRGSHLGLQQFRNGQWTVVTAPGFDGGAHRITALHLDKRHALWIGTTDEGIYRLYEGRVDHFDSHNGLSGDRVIKLYEDREGSLWAGTSGGIDQFRDLAVQAFSRRVYPRAEEFDNLVTTRKGTLWIGGDSTLYTLRNGRTVFDAQGVNLAGKQITTIFDDHAGRMWIGVDNTLNLFRDGKFIPVKMQDGSATGFIVSMAEEPDGSLWALTTRLPRRILSIDPRALRASSGIEVDASKILGDPRGGLWIGLNDGSLLHALKGKLRPIEFPHETGPRITQLSVTQEGALVAAGEFGLVYLRDGAAQVLGTRNGLPCESISDFIFDGGGDLWLYAQCGLIRIDQSNFKRWLAEPSALVHPRVFDASDGFRTFFPPFEGAARSSDGRLWFNGIDALQVVDPVNLHTNTVVPPVQIESFRGDSREYALAEMVELPALTRDIEINYSALSFVAPQKIDFRYRLAGFDSEWNDAGTRRQVVYTNLKPGAYQFQVIAANNDNVWNMEGSIVRFMILPKFYQTNWFMACVALASLALIYAAFVIRLRISTKLIEGRMNERLMERDRIARELHDTFLQGFQGIVLRLQGIAKMMSESAASRLALEDTMDRADQILTDGRRNLLQLRSHTGETPGLANRLHGVIADLQTQKWIACELSIQGGMRAFKPAVDEEIFAMAREVLTNAFRHSEASAILVELRFAKTYFLFRCADDGVGLPEAVLQVGSAEGRWGLVGLRERAEKLHAQLVLRKNEPHGAVVEVVLQARSAYAR